MNWLDDQDKEFKDEVGNLKDYYNKPCTLEELMALDERFINKSPEGGENNE